MKRITPNFSQFAASQRQVWPELAPLKDHGFVLYGGMGLSTRFGHRGSLDFDFFSSRRLDRAALHRDIPALDRAVTIQNERKTYTVSLPMESDAVRLSFFSELTLARVGEPESTDDEVCYVASIEDLAATKLAVILKRIQSSDYRDVLAIVNSGLSLADAIAAASAVYGSEFQPSDILKALVDFEGGDQESLTGEERQALRAIVASVTAIPVRPLASRDLFIGDAKPAVASQHTRAHDIEPLGPPRDLR